MVKITIDQVNSARQASNEASKIAHDLELAYAIQECPHAIGDIVEIKNGYSHKGKKMRVAKILLTSSNSWKYGKSVWRVVGPVLKADGTDGKFDGEEWGVC